MLFLWVPDQKGTMKKLFSLLILVAGLSFSAHAELVWKSGYIILTTGDSIKGDIRVNTKKELPLFQKVALKQGESTKTYKPEQVKEYAFDGNRFLSRKVDGEQQFLKVISYGRIILYELQFEMQRGDELIVDKDYYIEKNDGSSTPEKLKFSKFKKNVAELMGDNSELVTRVQGDDKKYEINDVQGVVEEYNSWYEQQNGSLQGSR
jgi:hypothetical protein